MLRDKEKQATASRMGRAVKRSFLRSLLSLRGKNFYKRLATAGLFVFAMAVIGILSIPDARVSALGIASLDQPAPQESSGDFSKFKHDNAQHARLPCGLCHRREDNSARPGLPGKSGHAPCAGCHAPQFSNSSSPICSICHTDEKSGALKPFPRLQSFRMKFDHSLHVRKGSGSCSTCHRPASGGVALSIPAGFNAHTTCYACHTARAQSGDRDISSCGTCHQLGGYSRTPQSAPAFRVGFNHAKHQKLTCNECHQVRAGMPQRRQVTAPDALNHHATGRGQSCLTCHDGKRAFGGDDFTVCKRCHKGSTWHF